MTSVKPFSLNLFSKISWINWYCSYYVHTSRDRTVKIIMRPMVFFCCCIFWQTNVINQMSKINVLFPSYLNSLGSVTYIRNMAQKTRAIEKTDFFYYGIFVDNLCIIFVIIFIFELKCYIKKYISQWITQPIFLNTFFSSFFLAILELWESFEDKNILL